jgi:hypothetical protein
VSFTFISVPKVETACTGLRGGMEKTYRGNFYRAELYPAGWALYKNGEKLRSFDELPPAIQKYAMSAKLIITSGEEMAR